MDTSQSHGELRDAVRALCAQFPDEYHRKVDAARAFLSGRDVSLLEKCRQKMVEAAERKKFETATVWRDRWQQLSALRRVATA